MYNPYVKSEPLQRDVSYLLAAAPLIFYIMLLFPYRPLSPAFSEAVSPLSEPSIN